MAIFVHFTEENNKTSIIKNGIKLKKTHYKNINKGVFCMPVIPDFYATHQWVRELKQFKSGNEIIAVYFKIPDNELVFCGKYYESIIKIKASETHKKFINLEDKMGFQTIIDRKIFSNEITKIKSIPQIIGWRHFPKSHELKRCLCPACLAKGSYNSMKSKKIRLKELFKKLRDTKEYNVIDSILDDINDLRIKEKVGTKNEKTLLNLLNTNDENLKKSILYCMVRLYGGYYKEKYRKFCFDNIYNGKFIDESLLFLRGEYGDKVLDEIIKEKCTDEVIKKIEEYKE